MTPSPTPQELGYFNRATPPVARLPAPIHFGSLVGQAEYRLKLQQLYRDLGVSKGGWFSWGGSAPGGSRW
jgi:hypothetical protein